MHLPSTPPPGASGHSARPATVLVADPHCCVREGLKALIGTQPDMRVVGEAADGSTALALAAALDPDLVVLEASLPDLDGAQVTARLREARPGRKVLVLTACEHAGTARLILGLGARGYVLKRAPAGRLLQAVRAVAAGGTFVDPEMAGSLAGAFLGAGAERPAGALSEREVQALRLVALGYSNKEIAARLKVSVKSAETYKARAMDKLQMHSRVDVVRYAVRAGWLSDAVPGPPPATASSPA